MIGMKQTDLSGQHLERERPPTKAGVITVFHNALVYGDPRDAFSYWEHKRGRKKAFGVFRGFIIGEVPAIDCGRVLFEYYRDDPKVEARKAHKRHLRRRGIPQWHYSRFLKRNPLERYLQGKPPLRPRKPEESLAHLKKRDQ